MSDKAKPAHKLRDRSLVITIWKNTSDNGPWSPSRPAAPPQPGGAPLGAA